MKQFFHTGIRARAIGRLRLAITVVLGVAAFGALLEIALPFFVSTDSVKSGMERVLSSWTGARARIAGEPQLRFWPSPQLTLRDVSFESLDPQASSDAAKLAHADAISARFNMLAALRGNPVFSDFRLVNPSVKVERRADGTFNWRRAGWMADAVAATAASGIAATKAAETPIGDIVVENGTLDLSDAATGMTRHIADISGSIDWPTPAGAIAAELAIRLDGEPMQVSFACDEPLTFFSGQNTALNASLTSAPVRFIFDGIANGSAYPFASGKLFLRAPSLLALLGERADQKTAIADQAVTLDAAVTVTSETVKMDSLSVSVGRSSATGVLDIALKQGQAPRLGGTLAFDQLDLTPAVTALLPILKADAASARSTTQTSARHLQVDLRLSAQEVQFQSIVLTNLAAGLMGEGGRLSLDIGDSTYAEGTLSGRIALVDNGARGGQMQLSLKDADLVAVAASAGLAGPLPLGRGTINVDLSSAAPVWNIGRDTLSGSLRFQATNGVMTPVNSADLAPLPDAAPLLAAAQTSDGGLAFSSADMAATLDKGIAKLTAADIVFETGSVSLAGIIAANGGLALSGMLKPTPTGAAQLQFFVGGAWPHPVISPVTALPASE